MVLALALQISAQAFALPVGAELAALKACSPARAHGGYLVVEGWIFTPRELRELRVALPDAPPTWTPPSAR